MIISRTPFRISFFGGGTDYPAWYLREGGAVLSTTIDKYLYMACRYLPPFFEMRHRIVWSKIENVWKIEDIQHPAIREGLRFLGFDDSRGLDIHYHADLPARSGMASSSAFAVGLINALHALRGHRVSKQEMALKAIELERDVLHETVGSQDQTAVANGGLNRIDFLQTGEIRVEPITIAGARISDFESHLMLFYTGISRHASQVAADVVANIPKKEATLREMLQMVDTAEGILTGTGSLDELGHLLHESWQLKRSLSRRITNSNIDGIYESARKAGALGGKLLGAGESGFLLFFVPPDGRAAIKMALESLLHVPFGFSRQGSTIIHYDPEEYNAGTTR
ncbi:MAG: kinase [Rhodospirillales bacterium]|jgi:D-glycero-alpha-D-manno-heptose-7-phosphate kinase|nr:kinase [Rhodospirillales bacterium]